MSRSHASREREAARIDQRLAKLAGMPHPPKPKPRLHDQPTTPRQPLSSAVQGLCKRLCPTIAPTFLPYVDVGAGYVTLECHMNVLHRVRTHGGNRINGWMVWECAEFSQAIFHSVWQDPSGELRDITPREDAEAEILFLPDPVTRLRRGPRGGIMQPNNPLSLGIYMSDGRLRPRPFDECLPNEELRAHGARLGIDPLAIADDEGLL